MRKALRVAAVLLIISMLICGCARPNEKKDTGLVVTESLAGKPVLVGEIPVAFPLTDEKASLNILATGYGGLNQETVYVWQKYEEMTGVTVNWTTVTREERAEKVYTALTNNKSLDLILRCKLSSNRLTQYGQSGLILNLAEDGMLKKYAPNCWAYLEAHPDALASVMTPDGAIYALPQINSGAELRVALKLFVNKTWLENVGMTLPATTEEFRELLIAFRDQDANGNGDPNDEIPFSCSIWSGVQQSLYGAFGLGNRGVHNLTVDCDPETGGVRLIAASEGYRAYLTYVNGLYADGLLDNYAFTITEEQWRGNASIDKIGVFASTNLALLPADKIDNWVAIEEALQGPNGDKLWMPIRANFHSTGAAVIPASCKNPELALKWLDYFWTDEGTLFYHMGIEGETFTALEDGTYDYAQRIYDEMMSGNHSFDDVVAQYSPYPGGSNPTVETAPYFMGGEMAKVPAQAARKLFEYGPTEYWPSFTYTAAESDTLNLISTDISKYISGMEIEFVTGKTPLTKWDEYLSQLDKLKTAELLAVYQAAADRYHALNTVLK